jgi:hypothetical protein
MALLFENVGCTRCGGGGHYSYCQMYGTTCFKCGGSGRQLTKRGRAAADYFRSLQTVKAADVKFGDCVRVDGIPGMSATTYCRVDCMYTQLRSGSSTRDGVTVHHNHLYLTGETPKGERYGLGTFPDQEVRLVPTKAQKAEQIAKAVAYQATLTKTGTVAKRAAAPVEAGAAAA